MNNTIKTVAIIGGAVAVMKGCVTLGYVIGYFSGTIDTCKSFNESFKETFKEHKEES